MMTSPRVIFFGTEAFSAPSLRALIAAGYDIAYVVTKPDAAKGRSKQPVAPLVKQIALEHKISVLQPTQLLDIQPELEAVADRLGILVAYGKILPKRTLDIFEPTGIINLHPSLLPRYRGPAPIEAAIVNGDYETGLSLMKLTENMDAGPILVQKKIALSGAETKPQLYQSLADQGAELLIATLPAILDRQIEPAEQKTDGVSYTSMLTTDDSFIDPSTEAAQQIERKVRAHLGYPKTHLRLDGNDVIITAAKVSLEPSASIPTLLCQDGHYIQIIELIASNGKKMSGEAYQRGRRR